MDYHSVLPTKMVNPLGRSSRSTASTMEPANSSAVGSDPDCFGLASMSPGLDRDNSFGVIVFSSRSPDTLPTM
jgi:hypothetical protein